MTGIRLDDSRELVMEFSLTVSGSAGIAHVPAALRTRVIPNILAKDLIQ
jgi:hypothetical protein